MPTDYDDIDSLLPFSDAGERSLLITERVASTFSILGCLFVFATFLLSKDFRRPANRLIFYACLGNFMMNIGTAIGLDGIHAAIRARGNSPLCQFQGFLFQMFLPADAFWNLSMAINVFLTVFRKYNAEKLRKLEWMYFSFNYGITFIIAFVYCFVSTSSRGRMYGPATLWCWVDREWSGFRIALVYAPSWVAIAAAFVIYAIAGREIFRKRRELHAFKDSHPIDIFENPFQGIKTTEVKVTSELVLSQAPQRSDSVGSVTLDPQSKAMHDCGYHQYSVYISKGAEVYNPFSYEADTSPDVKAANVALEANKAAWGYTKCAFLFFISLIITWLPSSIFRVHALVHDNSAGHFPLAYATGLVLPLMGFWNAVIYVATSWGAICKLADKMSLNKATVALGMKKPEQKRMSVWTGASARQIMNNLEYGSSSERFGHNERRPSFCESFKGLDD